MNGVSNNVNARPNYNATKKGTIAGATTGAVANGALLGLCATTTLPFKMNAPLAQKKNIISALSDGFAKRGIDMTKTTAGKVLKETINGLKSPKTFAVMIGAGALIGAGIGLAIDMIKNHKAKKEA